MLIIHKISAMSIRSLLILWFHAKFGVRSIFSVLEVRQSLKTVHQLLSGKFVKMLTRSPTATWMPAWVPKSTIFLSFLLMTCSMVQSAVSIPLLSLSIAHIPQTGGYDGSMMNGLNILPSYTNYFVLSPATTGLNTASIFIGGFFGPLVSGIISDHLGRRPAILWGSVITLIGVLLQTAVQDIAMFVVARIVLGFGAALSGIAGGVYLSETFPSQWRAWGVGMLNNFY
jgi:hypothetical protein